MQASPWLEMMFFPAYVCGEAVRVGASVGVVLSDGRTCADDLIRDADHAMYRDKQRRGKSRPIAA